MSSLTKTQKEESMDLKINKAPDKLNLKARKLTKKFNSLIIIEKIEKINNNERLEIEKTKEVIKKSIRRI